MANESSEFPALSFLFFRFLFGLESMYSCLSSAYLSSKLSKQKLIRVLFIVQRFPCVISR